MAEAQIDKIKTNCSNCGAEYVVFSSLAGKEVRCVKCQASFTVPQPQAQTHPGTTTAASQAAAASPAGQGAKAATDRHLKWLADNMIEIVCPHCRLVYPISKSFTGQYMACPRCRQKFIISPQGHAMTNQTPFERFLEDKAAVKAVVAAAMVLALIVMISVFFSSSRKSYLIGTLRAIYTVPNYEISLISAPKVHFVHKVNDGSRECPAVAYVHVAHPKTGMEFDRMLCRVDGVWSPTYYQRLLDEAALRALESMESGRWEYSNYSSDSFDEMVSRMFGQEASSYAEMYNRIPAAINEEPMLKNASIPAYDQLTHGNDWSDFFNSAYYDNEEEDFEYPDYRERYYLAHAVVYPDQANDLLRKGLIKEMP